MAADPDFFCDPFCLYQLLSGWFFAGNERPADLLDRAGGGRDALRDGGRVVLAVCIKPVSERGGLITGVTKASLSFITSIKFRRKPYHKGRKQRSALGARAFYDGGNGGLERVGLTTE